MYVGITRGKKLKKNTKSFISIQGLEHPVQVSVAKALDTRFVIVLCAQYSDCCELARCCKECPTTIYTGPAINAGVYKEVSMIPLQKTPSAAQLFNLAKSVCSKCVSKQATKQK